MKQQHKCCRCKELEKENAELKEKNRKMEGKLIINKTLMSNLKKDNRYLRRDLKELREKS